MSLTEHSDNGGFRASPHPNQSQPVITQTAQIVAHGTADTDGTKTVVPGKRYRFTSTLTGGFLFGLATTAVIGNIRWVCPIYQTIEIQIPYNITTLHYQTNVINGVGYLVEIKQGEEDDISK